MQIEYVLDGNLYLYVRYIFKLYQYHVMVFDSLMFVNIAVSFA